VIHPVVELREMTRREIERKDRRSSVIALAVYLLGVPRHSSNPHGRAMLDDGVHDLASGFADNMPHCHESARRPATTSSSITCSRC